MCGIAGIWNFGGETVSGEIIERMIKTMIHRGPDDEGLFVDGNLGLGHRRLSIIDLSQRGHQPMANEDNTIWIVFNGEIYNYKHLNKILASKGHKIKSNCDTETIIHLYEEYGTQCVDYLRGMFSFAIWDKKQKRLFAAVDRLRIKPFYYALINDNFIFASELKAIMASGLVPKKVSWEAIHHYLSLQAVPVPMTIYEDVFTLPGGYCLEVDNGKVSVWQYWDMSFQVDYGHSEEYYKNKLQQILYEAVEMRLMSDVPLGAFLSGGIDSSIIVGLMKDMQQEPIKTFSIGYDVGGKQWDDTYYARLVADKFHTDHTKLTITAEDIKRELKAFVYYLDQPSTDAINSYFVSKLASQDVTVVLCGQGGDELFAGYATFDLMLRFLKRDHYWEKLPFFFRRALENVFLHIPQGVREYDPVYKINKFLDSYGSFVKKYAAIRMELSEQEKNRVYTKTFLEHLNSTTTLTVYDMYYDKIKDQVDPINQISYMDLKTHLGDVLMRDVDVMSMAFSLETRIPLIDHKLVEFVASIPPEFKFRNGQKKYIFIEAMKYLLPEEVIKRPKMGFAFPLSIWLRHELKPLVDFVLSPKYVAERGLFHYHEIERLKKDFYLGRNLNYRKIWGFVVLELWMRLVLENDHHFFQQLDDFVTSKANET